MRTTKMTVDGRESTLAVESHWSLRKALSGIGIDLPAGCDSGHCGSCTILLGGVPTPACIVNAEAADGGEVATVATAANETLVEEFLAHGAVQCGYCTPGLVVSLSDLTARAPVTDLEVREALVGHLCRCTGYQQIVEATVAAASRIHHQPNTVTENRKHQ
jgi:aerobic-type carbon monoxide dehydrogenase small subunit (CoxS/CutS family)